MPKLVGVHTTDNRLRSKKLGSYILSDVSLAIELFSLYPNSRTKGCTFLKRTLADSSVGEKTMKPEVVGVHACDGHTTIVQGFR